MRYQPKPEIIQNNSPTTHETASSLSQNTLINFWAQIYSLVLFYIYKHFKKLKTLYSNNSRVERVSHLAREGQPRAARCRLLVIVMRVRTVALLSGEQKMAADWSRAAAGRAGRRREHISGGPGTSETASVIRFVGRARLPARVQVDHRRERAMIIMWRCRSKWFRNYRNFI